MRDGRCGMMFVPRSAVLLLVATIVDGFQCPPALMASGLLRHGSLNHQRGNGPTISMCAADNLNGDLQDVSDSMLPRLPSMSNMQIASRRSVVVASVVAALPLMRPRPASAADASQGLVFAKTPSGLQWADAKVGTGKPIEPGATCTIDYVMSTSGARYGSKIYSTKEADAPYRWVVGDGKTIKGLEMAITGGEGIPPMLPGGVRRVIVPSSLGYEALAKPLPGMQFQDCQDGRGPGPIPPELTGAGEGAYQRFKNIYCNANRPYQPDVVLDIKLYGRRES